MFMSARAGKSAPLDLCHVMNTIAHVNVICSRAGYVTFPRVLVKGIIGVRYSLFYYLLLLIP